LLLANLAQSDEDGFIKKAAEYTEQYATVEYHRSALMKWHEFYPKFPDVYNMGVALGRVSSIDNRLDMRLDMPQKSLQGEDELQAIEHPSVSTANLPFLVDRVFLEPTDAVCLVVWLPDATGGR
jgi:hypothetical protein